MSEKLPGGQIYTYGLFCGKDQIGFQCFANYTPTAKNRKAIYHFNRTVIHPDYNGLGMGIAFINETSRLITEKHGVRVMGKFSSIPVYKSMIRDSQWKNAGVKRLLGRMKSGKGIRTGGFRQYGIRTFHFEYIGTD